MILDSLEKCADDELRAVISRAGELLAERDRQRKDEAMERARAILAVVGLNLRDIVAKAKGQKAPSYRGGRLYQHPTDKTLIWTAKGQKPNWLRDLETRGGRAVEVPANDNAPAPARKTG